MVAWLKDGSPLRNLKRIEVERVEVGSLLTILNTRLTDEGTYSCVARNRIGEEESIDFSLLLSSSVYLSSPFSLSPLSLSPLPLLLHLSLPPLLDLFSLCLEGE